MIKHTKCLYYIPQIAYLKNGQIIFVKEVEELQQMNPNKSIDAIVDDFTFNINTDLGVSIFQY